MNEKSRFQLVCDLFEKARTLPESQRSEFLQSECGDDGDLIQEVTDLLIRHEEQQVALDQAVVPPTKLLQAFSSAEQTPERIGRYSIIRQVGRGGMGVVYLAKQDNPDREVAIKVMRTGFADREMRKRFELETAVLGRLQHPGIAQIYEAGFYDDEAGSRPYFAMEYVDGVSLSDHIRDHSPSIRQRLNLFTQICDAVNHAHQKGIIHRDLKPTNILVVESDSDVDGSTAKTQGMDPRIKILDFGVARSTDADLQVTSLQTDLGQLIGTLPYMSPEQIGGNPLDVDTRSDVYALGVILYELLSGQLPYEVNEKTLVRAVRVIADADPKPLSTVNTDFRGDLNTIALKALEKQPNRRYGSASDLASDIHRFLNNEPIIARRASAWYQFRKFASRNRGLFAGLSLAILSLIIGTIVSATFAFGQTRALRQSEKERRKSDAVLGFLKNDLLAQANPKRAGQKEMTVREALDNAAKTIDERFGDQPEIEAEIRAAIGVAYRGLGLHAQSFEHQSKALQYFETVLPKSNERIYSLSNDLVVDKLEQWQIQEAKTFSDKWLPQAQEHLGNNHYFTGRLLMTNAASLRRLNDFEKAEDRYRQAIAVFDSLGDGYENDLLASKNNLAITLRHLSRLEEAIELSRNVLEDSLRIYKDRPLRVAVARYGLADLLYSHAVTIHDDPDKKIRTLDESELLFSQAKEVREELLGPNHKLTVHCYYGLGIVASQKSDHVAAEKWLRQCVDFASEVYGTNENVYVLNAMVALAGTLETVGKIDESIELCQEAVEVSDKVLGQQHFSSVYYRYSLYAALWKQGDTETIRSLANKYNATATDRARANYAIGMANLKNGDVAAAVDYVSQALAELPKDDSDQTKWRNQLDNLNAELAEPSQDKLDEADP